MEFVLEITSWQGLSLGATHYYAHLKYYDENGEYQNDEITFTLNKQEAEKLSLKDRFALESWMAYKEGQETGRFDSRKKAIKHGIKRFRQLANENDILLLGSFSCGDPQEVLICPEPYKTWLNAVYKTAKRIGFWDKDEDAMSRVYDEWKKIMKEYQGWRKKFN